MRFPERFKIVKKLVDLGYIDNEHLKCSYVSILDEEVIEDMKREKEMNDKKIHKLRLKKMLLDQNILPPKE